MDFLKAFEQAQTLGITKEEFINVWESESNLKMAVSAGEMNPPITGYGDMKQASQIQNVDGDGSSVDGAVNILETRQEAKQDNPTVPDFMYRQLIGKYEQLCQQMHLKYDQLLHEFHSHFEVLSNHISNVEEAQANSLKLYFMHEIDLLKQDLRMFIEEQNTRPETEVTQPVIPTQKIGNVHSQNSSIYQDVISQPSSSPSYQLRSNNKDQENKNNPMYNNFQQNTDGFQFLQGDLEQPDFDYNLIGNKLVIDNTSTRQQALLKPDNSFADILKKAPVKSKINTSGMPAGAKKSPMYASAGALPNPGSTEAVIKLTKGSVAATGLLADTIANQMKHKQASQAGSVKSSTNSVKSEPVTSKQGKKKAKSYISNTSSARNSKYEFTVQLVSNWVSSKMSCKSPYVYSSGTPCKVQVVLNVSEKFVLAVHVHVSKSDFDDSHKWPLTLKGNGYVFNPGSQRFTPLWELESVICEKPPRSDKELIFPTVVCLMTSKRNMKDVTLQELTKRYKVGEDSLTFLWDLKATEKQKVAEG